MTVPVPSNAVVYRTNIEDPRTSTLLAVAPNGRCLLLAGSNRRHRVLPVGRFQGTAPPGLMVALRQRLFSDAFRQSVSLDAVAPDEACRSITIPGEGTAPTVKLAAERSESPEFLAVEDIFSSLIDHLRRFPATVLLAEIVRVPTQVLSGAKSDIVLRLRNPGSVPVLVPSPETWGEAGACVELSALRAGAGKPRDRAVGMQCFAACGARSVRGFQPRSVRGLVPILPAASLEVDLEPVLDWPDGRYVVDLTIGLRLHDAERNPQMTVIACPPAITLAVTNARPL